ncbi:hypothetical protein ACHAXM_001250 [Skeletonema potamos]
MMSNKKPPSSPSSSSSSSSSPLKILKAKSPKNLFAKKKNNKEIADNSTPKSANSSTHNDGSTTKSDHVSCNGDEQVTPTLSNTAIKLLNKHNGIQFPILPNIMGEDNNDHILNSNHDDGESVAAMSDILNDNHSLDDHSLNDSYESDGDYYKQDYYSMGDDEDKSSAAAAAAEGEADGSQNNDRVKEKETKNVTTNEVVTKDYDANVVAVRKTPSTTTPRRENKAITSTDASTPNSISKSRQSTPVNTPGSKVSFHDDEMSFNSNLKTPPHLSRLDVFATTPKSSTNCIVISSPITPLEELKTPGGSTNAPKVLMQNKKLRAGRKELLKVLGSTAKQFSTYEKVASQKIFELEERIRKMEEEQQKSNANEDRKEDPNVSWANENRVDGVTAAVAAPDAAAKTNSREDKSKEQPDSNNKPKTTAFEKWKGRSSYDPETERKLSNEIMEQQKQVYIKEKFISSLKLRCETLKRCLNEKEDELAASKKAWEKERLKLFVKLQDDNPKMRDHGEILSLKLKNEHLTKELDCALKDVDMLSDALEKNNEALDNSVSQLERLREWKIEHEQMEEERHAVCEPIQPIEEEKPEEDEEEEKVQKESELDRKSVAAMEEMKLTIIEKEQQIETLEGSLKEKGLEIVQLQIDLDSCFKEIESLKQLVDKTATANGYEDFQSMVEQLKDEAIKSEIKATAFNERISELESEVQAKNTEILQLKMSIEDKQKSFVEQEKYDDDVPPPEIDHLHKCNSDMESNSSSLLLTPGNDSVSSMSPGASPTESRRWSGLSFARKLAKEGRQYAAAVGSANDPDSMLFMIRERDRKINSLEATIESNTLMIEKLKKDVERMDTEHEEALVHSTYRIEQLEDENALYLQQVEGFEKAFMTLNESQLTSLLPSFDEDGAKTPDESIDSDKDEVANEQEREDLKAQNAKLERMLSELREENSFQEDQIENLKTVLTTLRVVSQQEKENACDKLRDENKIIEAQRSALENQLLEINKSAALLRDSLAQDNTTSLSSSIHVGADQVQNVGRAGSDPILVTQLVKLENANKVLESSLDSLRSGQQEILAPLLERIALLEEEKRIIEEEMHTKIQCREQTISNLEDSLKQATQSRLSKKKKTSALKISEQLLARAKRATSD